MTLEEIVSFFLNKSFYIQGLCDPGNQWEAKPKDPLLHKDIHYAEGTFNKLI